MHASLTATEQTVVEDKTLLKSNLRHVTCVASGPCAGVTYSISAINAAVRLTQCWPTVARLTIDHIHVLNFPSR